MITYSLHYGETRWDTGFEFADLTSAASAAELLSRDDPMNGAWHVQWAPLVGCRLGSLSFRAGHRVSR